MIPKASDVFTWPNAARMGISGAADYLGALTGPGYFPISAAGGFLGEFVGQSLEDKPYNWGLMATEAAMNPLFPGPSVPGKGAGLKEFGKFALGSGLAGAQQGAYGSLPRWQAEQGNLANPLKWELPSPEYFGGQTLAGTAFGGGAMVGLGAVQKGLQYLPTSAPSPANAPVTGSQDPFQPSLPGMENVRTSPDAQYGPTPFQTPARVDPADAQNRVFNQMDAQTQQAIFELTIQRAEAQRAGDVSAVTQIENAILEAKMRNAEQQRNWTPPAPPPEAPAPIFGDMGQDQGNLSFGAVRGEGGRFRQPGLFEYTPLTRTGDPTGGPNEWQFPPAPEPPPPDMPVDTPPAQTTGPDIIDMPTNQTELAMRKAEGYKTIPNHRGPNGQLQMVRGQMADMLPPTPTPVAAPVVGPVPGTAAARKVPGKFRMGDDIPVPTEIVDADRNYVKNMEDNGYAPISNEGGVTVFRHESNPLLKKLLTDESGTFDPQEMWENLKRLLGREPTQAELNRGMNRQIEPGDVTGRVAPFQRTETFKQFLARTKNITDRTDFDMLPAHIREDYINQYEISQGKDISRFGEPGPDDPMWNRQESNLPTEPELDLMEIREAQTPKQVEDLIDFWHRKEDEWRASGETASADHARQMGDAAITRLNELNTKTTKIYHGDSPEAADLLRSEIASMENRIANPELRPDGTRRYSDKVYDQDRKFLAEAKADLAAMEQRLGISSRGPRAVRPGDVAVPRTGQMELPFGPKREQLINKIQELTKDGIDETSTELAETIAELTEEQMPLPLESAISPTSKKWTGLVKQLDEMKAPDALYREIIASPNTPPLKAGETWRQRVLKGIAFFESKFNKGIERLGTEGGEEGAINIGSMTDAVGSTIRNFFARGPATPENPKGTPSTFEQLWGLPTAATTIADLSMPLRQGLAAIFTPEWRAGLKPMWQSFWSAEKAREIDQQIRNNKVHQKEFNPSTGKWDPTYAERANMKLAEGSDINSSEHDVAGAWIETGGNLGGVSKKYEQSWGRVAKMSNRAAATFLNHLRTGMLERLSDQAQLMAEVGAETGTVRPNIFKQKVTPEQAAELNPYYNDTAAKTLGDYINTATGRAPLKLDVFGVRGTPQLNLEFAAKAMGMVFFSPRNMFSRARLLYPGTYTVAPPFVRKQYLKSALATGAAWATMTTLAKVGAEALGYDAEVSLDPESADFGKMRIGKTRLDLGGGFLPQYVAMWRLWSGFYRSSSTGQRHAYGQGFRPETERTQIQRFFENKFNPAAKFGYDLLDAAQYTPFHVADRTAQMFVPLVAQDLYEMFKEDPKLIPILMPPVMLGGGTQIYGRGEQVAKIVPKNWDWIVKGGGVSDIAYPANWQIFGGK